jgi:hypothetical protein
LRNIEWSRLFTPSFLEFGESSNEEGGGFVHGSQNRTMFCAIPRENSS